MPTPTFAKTMVTKLEGLLSKAAGLKTVSVDGTMTTFDDLTAQYQHWKREVEKEAGRRPRVAGIDLSGF